MENKFFCGVDLGLSTTQISYYKGMAKEPESACPSGEPAGGLPKEVYPGQGAPCPDKAALERYLSQILDFIRQCAGKREIGMLGVTLPAKAGRLERFLAEAFARFGIKKEKLLFLSHTECFMYYTVNMPVELWTGDVALFDYDGEDFYYERLAFSRKKQPIPVTAQHQDFAAESLELVRGEESQERKSYWFYNTAMQQLHKQQITTVYVTGAGFSGGWAEDALHKLCDGRRVFFGQNLYTKGACYAAKMAAEKSSGNYIFLGENMIRESISLRVYHDARNRYLELAKAGMDYRRVGKKLQVILDDTSEIEFLVDHCLKRGPVHEVMILDNLMKSENKTIRLELTFFYADRDTPVVQVRDIGFGVRNATCRIWEQIL